MVFEDGRQMRDFVSVHDVVRANLLAMESDKADCLALNIGSGSPVSIAEVAAELSNCLGENIPAEITCKYRVGDIRHCFADITAARKVIGYQPRQRFSDGIAELVEWLRSQTAVDKEADMVRELSAFGLTA